MPRITGHNSSNTDYSVKDFERDGTSFYFLPAQSDFDILVNDVEFDVIVAQLEALAGVTFTPEALVDGGGGGSAFIGNGNLLAHVTGIDLTAETRTTLYTAPAGVMITGFWIRYTTVTGLVQGPNLSAGVTPDWDEAFGPTSLPNNFTGVGSCADMLVSAGWGNRCGLEADEILKLDVNTAADADALVCEVFVFGTPTAAVPTLMSPTTLVHITVDLTEEGQTETYVVPAGKKLCAVAFFFGCTAVDNKSANPEVRFGIAPDWDDVFGQFVLGEGSTTGWAVVETFIDLIYARADNLRAFLPAGSVLKFDVAVAAVADELTAEGWLVGFLVDA